MNEASHVLITLSTVAGRYIPQVTPLLMPPSLLYLWFCNVKNYTLQKGQVLTSNSLMDTDPPNPEYVLMKAISPPVPLKPFRLLAIQEQSKWYNLRHECSIWSGLTLVVLILLPVAHIHPELSGSVLHSSPSRQGSISHHHFPITMEAAGKQETTVFGTLPYNPVLMLDPSAGFNILWSTVGILPSSKTD